MLAAHQTSCWLSAVNPSPASLLYASPSASDQSHSSASFTAANSAQPSPAIPKMEHKLMAPSAAGCPPFCAPSLNPPGPNPHQHFANFVQSAFGNGFPAGGGMAANGPERMRAAKRRARPVPEERKDEAYKERRRKNNESAQRSRQIRRRKEEETQMRNAELEAEIGRLKQENYGLMLELFQFRQYFGVAVGGGHQNGGGMLNIAQPKNANPL